MEKEVLINPILWAPTDERIQSSQIFRFKQNVNKKYNLNLVSFSELHNWSIKNKADFWSSIWDFFQIVGSKGEQPYVDPVNKMPGSKFFPSGKVNYAENMLSGNIAGQQLFLNLKIKLGKISWKHLNHKFQL